MIAYQAIISGANRILKKGPLAAWSSPRRVPARSRVPANRTFRNDPDPK
jgi:hypothetical protein